MKAFSLLLLGMLREYATSKKVLTAVLTALVPLVVHDPVIREWVMGSGLTLLLALAAQDHGKAAAEINAAAPKPAQVVAVMPVASGPLESGAVSASVPTLAPLAPLVPTAPPPAPRP